MSVTSSGATAASPSRAPRYIGPERRRHCIFITRNSEYHCRDGVCLAVRDGKTGTFVQGHPAVGLKLALGVRFERDGHVALSSSAASLSSELLLGKQLCFTDEGDLEIVTSVVRAVQRPPREVAELYPSRPS
jgi:hypothetical protein